MTSEKSRRFNLTFRPANELRDWRPIVEFYFANERKHLPPPTADQIYNACEDGFFYVVHESTEPTDFLACAGTLVSARGTNSKHSDPNKDTQVYELTGALVRKLGGTSPNTIHEILVWLRTVGVMVLNGFGPSPSCFISSVIDANADSIATLDRCRLQRMTLLPHWLEVESRSWVSGANAHHYYVPFGAFQNHANALYNLVKNKTELTRRNKSDGVLETYSLIFEIPWLIDGFAALEAIVTGKGDSSVAQIVEPPKYCRTKGGLL